MKLKGFSRSTILPIWLDRFVRHLRGQCKTDLGQNSKNRFILKQSQVELLALDRQPAALPHLVTTNVEKHLKPVLEKVHTQFPLRSGRLGE
jgi:hypothetical protein